MSSSIRLALSTLMVVFSLWASHAHAGVTVTPNTLLIEGRERYTDLSLINASDAPNTYEMSWKFFRMEEGTGKYIALDAPTTGFNLADNIVYTPRRITLMPNKAQKIRLALRLKEEPPAPGDYRAHFVLREASDASSPSAGSKGAQVGVRIKVGFSIPVIYRVGESDATATIGSVKTRIGKTGKIEAVIPVTKSKGPYGILGNLAVYHQANGEEKQVAGLSNANIFPEITSRTFVLPLNITDLRNGSLHIIYRDRREDKNVIYAEKIIPVGK